MVWAIADQDTVQALEQFRDFFDVGIPILPDEDGLVHADYTQTSAYSSAAYPQEWLVGTDGNIAYVANALEYDALVAAIEGELAD